MDASFLNSYPYYSSPVRDWERMIEWPKDWVCNKWSGRNGVHVHLFISVQKKYIYCIKTKGFCFILLLLFYFFILFSFFWGGVGCVGDYIYGLEPTCLFLECSVRRCTSISLFFSIRFRHRIRFSSVYRYCTCYQIIKRLQTEVSVSITFCRQLLVGLTVAFGLKRVGGGNDLWRCST